MKKLSQILIAICGIAFLSQVAYSTTCDKAPKTCYAVSIEKSNDVVNYEVNAVNPFVAFIEVSTQITNKIFISPLRFETPGWQSQNYFNIAFIPFSIAMLPDEIFSPNGSIAYIENKKLCYKSPHVDNSWVWKYSVRQNC